MCASEPKADWIDRLESTEKRTRAAELSKGLKRSLSAGDWKTAHDTAAQMAAVSPTLDALSAYFIAAVSQRKLREAARVVEECMRIQADQPAEFWDLAGCLFLDMDNMGQEAIHCFLKGMPALEANAAAVTNLALAYHAEEKTPEAVRVLEAAAKAAPSSRAANLLKFLVEGGEAQDHRRPLRFGSPVTLYPYPAPVLTSRWLAVEGAVNAMESAMKMEVRLKDSPGEVSPFVEWRKVFVSCWADGGLHLQFGTVMKVLGPTLVTVSVRRAFKRFQRRAYKRIPVQSGVSGVVACERLHMQVKLDLLDLSAGGCQLYFPIPLEVGDVLQLSFTFGFPDISARFDVAGIARTIKPLGNQFVAAVEFEVDEETQERLDQVLTKCEFRLRKF